MLYRRHGAAMRRAAAGYLRAHSLDTTYAEDAVSEVIRRLLTRMPEDVTGDAWEPYLIRAAVNAAKDQLKAVMRRNDRVGRTGDISETYAEQVSEQDLEDEVTTAVHNARMCEHVLKAIDTLPEGQRRAVGGRLLHRRTNVDLAEEDGTTSQNVSQAYTAGLRRIIELLAGLSW